MLRYKTLNFFLPLPQLKFHPMSYCSGILNALILQGQGAALSGLSIDNKRFWLSPAWEAVGRLLRVIYSTVAFSTCCVLGVGGFVA